MDSSTQIAKTYKCYLHNKLQWTQLSPRDLRDALYQLRCCPTVVQITQTDRVSAWALSATARFYSVICIVLYTHRCSSLLSRLNYRTASMRCSVSPNNNNNNNNNLRLFRLTSNRAITVQHPLRRAALLYRRLKPAKLLTQYGAQRLNQPRRLNLVSIHYMARPAYIR